MRCGPTGVPLCSEFVISLSVLVVCGDLFGVGIAHEDWEFGLVKYLSHTYHKKHVSFVYISYVVGSRE